MGRQTVSDEVKAAALADLATGEQPAVVAQRYRLNAATVRKWKERQDVTPVVTQHVTPVVTQIDKPTIQDRQARLADLVIQNLEAKLIATQRIAEHAATNTTWLNKQSAAELATFFGILDQSAIGILDRLAGRVQSDDTGDQPA